MQTLESSPRLSAWTSVGVFDGLALGKKSGAQCSLTVGLHNGVGGRQGTA